MPTDPQLKPHEYQLATLWGLDEPLRLPTGPDGWETFDPRLLENELQVHRHQHDYASFVGQPSRQECLHQVARLMRKFPADFKEAAESISPEGWQLLYYRSHAVLGCLAHTRFHADLELRRLCELTDPSELPPAEWIGGEEEPHTVAEQTYAVLRAIGPEPAKAAYCILAAAQVIGLSPAEVLRCAWWSPAWIENLSARLNTNC